MMADSTMMTSSSASFPSTIVMESEFARAQLIADQTIQRQPQIGVHVDDSIIKATGVVGAGKVEYIREDQLRSLDVTSLRKMGLGRAATGYCYSTKMTLHAPLSTVEEEKDPHPEQPGRIVGIYNKLNTDGLISRMSKVAIREATNNEVTLVHSESHWARVYNTADQSPEWLDSCASFFQRQSLYVNGHSAYAARLSCGGVIEMCRAVAEGSIRNGFAIVRPPGHHAEPEEPMGFCFFNNAAVAARWLTTIYGNPEPGVKPIRKVLILDWDVHHGNGTQKAFYADSDVLYISVHRFDGAFYPGGSGGDSDMIGEDAGKGFNVNIPFRDAGMTDSDYLYAFQRIVMPIAYEFAPDFVIVSAGYDAAEGDTLGEMKVSPAGFAHMTHMLSVLAEGRLVLALEGGYNVDSIANSAAACVQVLLGDEPPPLELNYASLCATETVHNVTMVQRNHWKCMGTAAEGLAELQEAGTIIPLAEIFKAHRTYDLYHTYSMYNVAWADPILESAFKDQLLCSGYVRPSLTAMSLDLQLQRSLLLDTSRLVLDWIGKEDNFGILDINLLPHPAASRGGQSAPSHEKRLAHYVFEHIIQITKQTTKVILIGSGIGCAALVHMLSIGPAIQEKVRACISVLGLEDIPVPDRQDMRVWYKEHSLVLLPSTHKLHQDFRAGEGKYYKKFGNVHRSQIDDESRPLHLLKASLPRIKEFVAEKLRENGGQ